MALNNLGLGFVFTARNLASGTINRLDRQVGGLAGRTRRAGTSMRAGFAVAAAGAVTMAVGFGTLAVAARAGLQANREFGAAIAEVETLLPEAARNTEQLRNSVLGLTTQFGGQPQEQARALYQTISAGISDTGEAMTVLDVANRNAIAGVTDVNTSVDLLTTALNSYGLGAEDAELVSDQLFTTVRLGKTTMGELGSSLGRMLPATASLGIGIDVVGAALAAMTQNGLQTSRAVSGFNAAIANIRRPTADAEAEARRLGITFNSTALRAQGLEGFLQGITENADFSATTMEQLFGSVEAVNAISSLTANSMEVFSDAIVQMETASGATNEAFRIMAETFDFQIRRLEGRFAALRVRVGELIEPILAPFVSILSDAVEMFLNMPAPMQRMAIGTALVALATLGLAGALATVAALVVIIAPVFVAILKVMGLIALAFAPVIIIALALGAAIATMVFLVKNNIGGLGDFFDETFGKVRLAFRALVQLFSSGTLSGEVREELAATENSGIRRFVFAIARIGGRIKAFFEGIGAGFQAFSSFLEPRVERMAEAFREIGVALGFVDEGADALAGTSMDDFAEAGVKVGEVIADIMGFVIDAITDTAQFIGGFITGIQQAFEFFSPVFDALFESFSDLGEEIGELFRELGIFTDEGGDSFAGFGEIVGNIVGFVGTVIAGIAFIVVNLLRIFVALASGIISAWEPVKTFFIVLGIAIEQMFDGIRTSMNNSLDQVIAAIGRAVAVIPAALRPAGFSGIVSAGQSAEARISESEGDFDQRTRARNRRVTARNAEESAAAAATAAATEAREGQGEDVVAELRRGREEARRDRLEEARRPIQVSIDGEVVATAVAGADRRAGARGFVPVPADAE